MSIAPPSDFARTFRALVVPDLKALIPARGLFVALGMEGFVEAHADLLMLACRRGASCLPPDHRDALDEWISTELLAAVLGHEPTIAAAEQRADGVARDLAAHERRFNEWLETKGTADVG